MAENKITLDRVDEILRIVFDELGKADGRARPKDLLAVVGTRLEFTKYELERVRSGPVRWENTIRFYTIDCAKAGYLGKSGGYWTLMDEGRKALELPKGQLIRSAMKRYQEWKSEQVVTNEEVSTETVVESDEAERQVVYDQAVEDARAEIDEHINKLGPYEFQKLIAELLRAMGYFVPFVAPPGPDGGVDIVAYKDPLGTTAPRIRVQVKHRKNKVSVSEIRELEATLRKEGDIALFVSSGGFTASAEQEIRSSLKHIEAMDLDRVVALWQEHYDKLSERGKLLMPLAKVYFLAPSEE